MLDLAARFSEACARAGIATLVAAGIAVTLAQRLAIVEPLSAFGNYVTAREILKLAVNELIASAYWPQLLTQLGTDPAKAEDLALGQLDSFECVRSNRGTFVRPARTQSGTLSISQSSLVAPIVSAAAQPRELATPLPPSDVNVESIEPCPGMRDIYLALTNLTQDQEIELARRLSAEADLQLYSWQLVRNRVYGQAAERPLIASRTMRAGVGPQHSTLTLRELRELNSHPHLSQSEYSALANSLLIVTTPYASVNQGANSAALLVQVAMVIFMAYCYLNVRAAARVGALHQPGSLFEILTRDNWGRGFLVILVLLPSLAAGYLAFNMTGIEGNAGIVLALVTIGLTLIAGLTLWGRSRPATERSGH